LPIDLRRRERALLVTVAFHRTDHRDSWPAEDVAEELRQLVASTNVDIVQASVVTRDAPTPNLLIGTGKVEELRAAAAEAGADVAIFNQNLSPAQQRNLEEALDLKVIDRTQLILEIFAQRAHSQEGKVQVALAQYTYLLPRLTGKGIALSRLGGGIGTRGPGEQKLEVDRRRIRAQIARLKQDLAVIRQRRGRRRQERQGHAIPTVALVGYTNAGKTTLLNALTHTQADAKDQLFTTLDPMARRLTLPTHQVVILNDTVGFLHALPHHLIEAFQATLEEVHDAQLLLHVVDASHPLRDAHLAVVEEVVRQLHADGTPRLTVFNKLDRLPREEARQLQRQHPEAVCIAALTGEGLPQLLDRLVHQLAGSLVAITLTIPRTAQVWVHRIYEQGAVTRRQDTEAGIQLEAWVSQELRGMLAHAGFLT